MYAKVITSLSRANLLLPNEVLCHSLASLPCPQISETRNTQHQELNTRCKNARNVAPSSWMKS